MATPFQHDFVNRMEEALRGRLAQSKDPPSISDLMRDAGSEPTSLFAIVTRLKENKEKDLLSRLRTVFERARKMPLCLEDIKPSKDTGPLVKLTDEDNEEIQAIAENLQAHAGVGIKYTPSAREMARNALGRADMVDDALFDVLKILGPLTPSNREVVISTAMRRYGVGE